ncbi:MAG: phosphatase PAP2 family protein [Nocardioidaceae bacterium]
MSTLTQTSTKHKVLTRPWLIGELLIVLALIKGYDYVRSLEAVRRLPALHNAQDLVAIERTLHLHFELAANRWLALHDSLSVLMSYYYEYAHASVTICVLVCCYVWRPNAYRPARNALIITNCVGMVIFVVLPVMPPRLLPHSHFIDSVALAGFGSTHGGPVAADQYGAMPSLHLAWATWTAVMLWVMVRHRVLRVLAVIYPTVTAIVVLLTANHYLLDVFAGVLLALAAVALTGVTAYAGRPVWWQPVKAPETAYR